MHIHDLVPSCGKEPVPVFFFKKKKTSFNVLRAKPSAGQHTRQGYLSRRYPILGSMWSAPCLATINMDRKLAGQQVSLFDVSRSVRIY